MTLKDYIKITKEDMYILMFNDKGELETRFFFKHQLNEIPNSLLKREYMESETTNDGLEVWIR